METEAKTAGTPKLNAALAKAQATFGAAKKDALNPAFKGEGKPQGSKYADLASVVEATRPALTANGLAVTQEPMEAEEGWVKVRTVLLHESGEERASTLKLPCAQKTAQAYGSAVTYARRYGYCAMVGVVADEDDDGNAASAKSPEKSKAADRSPRAAPKTEGSPKSADDVTREVGLVRAAAQTATLPAEIEALRPRYDALRAVLSATEWTGLGAFIRERKEALAAKPATAA